VRILPRLCLVALVTIAIPGCDREASKRAERLEAENAALRKELDEVKRELDTVKFGPSRLLSQLEIASVKSDWNTAKAKADELLKRHPESPEAAKAKQLLPAINTALAKAAKEAEAAEARRIEAEKKQKLQEERRLAASLSKMHKTVDKVENVTWYRDHTSPRFTNYNAFYLYIGKNPTGSPWLRLRVQYNSEDWLFIESFIVVADERRFESGPVRFKRDHSSEIWEWYDEEASPRDLDMVRAIVASKNAVIRFNGRQYRRDRTINATEKAAFQNVLDAYKVLGGS